MKKLGMAWTLFVLMMLPIEVNAAGPLEIVQIRINQVLEVLRGDAPMEVKREKIRAIGEKQFDFFELSKRTLGRNWRKFNREQREEFVGLLKGIIGDLYLKRILKYDDQEVEFGKETMIAENRAEVDVEIVSKTRRTPVAFRLVRKNDEWKAYDLTAEGISLMQNYRSQFNNILKDKPPAHLLETLRKKRQK
jgi:phospholipid transport system substrate-binding protein